MKDDFSSSVNSMSVFLENDLAPKFPKTAPTDETGKSKNKFTAKYAKFILDESGNPELEAIMNDVLAGKKLLAEEKWYFTKDGDSVIVIKYLVPQDTPVASDPKSFAQPPGRRRQRKALIKKEENQP